jgi:hypothetical protein
MCRDSRTATIPSPNAASDSVSASAQYSVLGNPIPSLGCGPSWYDSDDATPDSD